MIAITITLLWIGSAIAGWFSFWPWLFVPVAFAGLHILRAMSGIRAARKKWGISTNRRRVPGISVAGANAQLLVGTLLQHLAIFGLGAGLHWLVG